MVNLAIPPETAYTDIERDLIDNEPPGLFPGDQISVWGQVRKVYADYMQYNLADVLNEWYMNLDPRTVGIGDVPEWEYMLDTPENSALSIERRRSFLASRREQGAFTRSRRARLVESFITATFGPATDFTPDGLPFNASGIPLYSGVTSLAGTYSIREPMDNAIVNGGFETDTAGWTTAGTATISRDTAEHFAGAASLKVLTGAANSGALTYVPPRQMIQGDKWTLSVYVKATGATIGKTFRCQLNNTGGALGDTGNLTDIVLTAAWQRVSVTTTVDQPDRIGMYGLLFILGGVSGETFWLDNVQYENGTATNSYVDGGGNPFSYDVRILNTITIDTAGLTRELQRITPSGITFTITPTATP
jgi:hypothetical protein